MGSLGWVSEFFEVRAQVDRGLTTVDHLTGYYVQLKTWGVTDTLLFSSLYRPVGKPVSHHVVTRPTFSSSSFLDHHTGHPARYDARILLYECIFDTL
jgi:hypothetical protein